MALKSNVMEQPDTRTAADHLYGADKPLWIEERNITGATLALFLYSSGSIATPVRTNQTKAGTISCRATAKCQGKRLKPEALSVRLGQYRITNLTGASIRVSAQDKHNATERSPVPNCRSSA